MASRMAASLALAAGTPESVIAVGGSPALSRTAVSEYEQMGVHLGLRRDGGTLHNALQAQRLSSSLFDTPAVRRPDSPLRGPSLTGCTPLGHPLLRRYLHSVTMVLALYRGVLHGTKRCVRRCSGSGGMSVRSRSSPTQCTRRSVSAVAARACAALNTDRPCLFCLASPISIEIVAVRAHTAGAGYSRYYGYRA
jgi:hypothetical protein